VFVAEFSLERVLEVAKTERKYVAISKFPKVVRELSIVADRTLSADRIVTTVQKHGKPLVEAVQVVDLFSSDKLGAGKMSVSISMTLADPMRTLEETVLEGVQQKIIQGLSKDLGVELRK